MVDHLMPYVAPFKMLILRMQWNSGTIVPTLRIPTLFLAGAKDTLVPHSHMVELYNRMKSSKVENLVRMHIVDDGTHNETWMQGGKTYWLAIQRFMDETFAAEQPLSGNSGNINKNNDGPLYQRKGTGLTAVMSTSSCDSSSAPLVSSKESIEVDLGCAEGGGDAADMISSVGNFMGMAREAVAGGVKSSGVMYKKKD